MNMKKLFLLNLPYLLFVYPFDKLAQAFRLAPGADLSGKLLSIGDGFTAAFSSPWLSFQPTDLLIGIAGAVILRMAVYLKGKNAKKYRHGIEYGSARWGTAADIAPYMDKDFFQNIPMTQTERITMASRPKQPKYARNKNILVIGGSGSGKTRFFCKPSLLQAHSSYVCTDPKGTLLPEIGTFLERKKYGERCQFDAYCKLVLYHEAIDYLREMQRRRDRELSFSDLSQMEMDKLCVVDHYPSDRFTFSSHGYDLHIENELVADAFAGLSVQEQSILILHFVLDLPDQEVGRLVGMSRSAVQRRRAKSLTELRIKLAALMPKGG